MCVGVCMHAYIVHVCMCVCVHVCVCVCVCSCVCVRERGWRGRKCERRQGGQRMEGAECEWPQEGLLKGVRGNVRLYY